MDLVGIAEIVSAAAVLVGFGFAVSEVKRHRGHKARESALALVSAYQTPEFANAIVRWPMPPLSTGVLFQARCV